LGLVSNTDYDFRVRSTNAAGESAWAELLGILTLPEAPTDLVIDPGADPTTELSPEWTDNGLVTNLFINLIDNFLTATDLGPWTPSLDVTGLIPATQYFFWLVSENATGDSAPSNSANGSTDL
jgi:hypothetical protein